MNQTLLRYVTYSRAPNKRTGWLLENEHYTHLVSQWGRFGNIQKRNLSSLLSFWGHSHLCLLLQNTFLCKSKHGWLWSQKIFKLRQTKLSQFSNEISGPDICSLIQGGASEWRVHSTVHTDLRKSETSRDIKKSF